MSSELDDQIRAHLGVDVPKLLDTLERLGRSIEAKKLDALLAKRDLDAAEAGAREVARKTIKEKKLAGGESAAKDAATQDEQVFKAFNTWAAREKAAGDAKAEFFSALRRLKWAEEKIQYARGALYREGRQSGVLDEAPAPPDDGLPF